MSANKKAFALIGVSFALIAFQVAAIVGATVGARVLMRSEPAAATLRAASVVASSVASTVAQNGVSKAGALASQFLAEAQPLQLAAAPRVMTVAQTEKLECYIVGPSGELRAVDLSQLGKVLETKSCWTTVIELEKVMLEVERQVTEKLSECSKIEVAQRPTI